MTEPVTPLTPRPVRFAAVGQWWRDVTFLHWAVPPASVAGFLPAGRRGVVFLSLDASRLVPVLGAQVSARLPYKWSSMRLDRFDDVLAYTSKRIWPGPPGASSRVVVRTGKPVQAGDLERFLTARWGLHVAWHGRTIYLPNDHPEWPLHQAELLELDDELVAAAGLDAPQGPPVSVLHSPGVPVRFGVPVLC